MKRSVCVRRLVTDTKRAKGCRSSALTTLRPEPSSFSGRTCLLRRSFSRRALSLLPATATGSAGHASRHSAGPAATGLGNQARRRGVYSTDILDIDGESRHGRTQAIPAHKKFMDHYDSADVRSSENSCRRCPRKSESREKERWPSREGASSSPDVRRGAPHHDGPLRAAPEPASTPVDAPDAAPCAAAACFSCCSILERPVSVGGMQSTHHVKRHRTRKKRSTADAQSSFSDGRWPIDSCIARRSLIVFFA